MPGKRPLFNQIPTFYIDFYDRICIRFDQVPNKWTLKNNELCNLIKKPRNHPSSIVESKNQVNNGKTVFVNDI